MPSSTMPLSAFVLREALRGRRLNEGGARVLQKLETLTNVDGLRRIYVRSGSSVTMWDLVSEEELSSSGYIPTRHSCNVPSENALKRDRVTYWISEAESSELWVGEPLEA
jgi:hypothetical protein